MGTCCSYCRAKCFKKNAVPIYNESAKMYIHDLGDTALRRERLRLELIARPQRLEEHDEDYCTVLHVACKRGQFEAALLLVELGSDLGSRELYWRNTALHLAAQGGYFDIAAMLVQQGCDTAAKNRHGKMAIDYVNDLYPERVEEYLRRTNIQSIPLCVEEAWAPGSKVITIFGPGHIIDYCPVEQFYNVQVAYGIATLSPAALISVDSEIIRTASVW